ncbi:MAG: hypothetical protein FD143_3345 [Ignavibacteria bacterium]|nr:MAG: hypothetical protein FD143_3345 [Ignavibacteria bacterium]
MAGFKKIDIYNLLQFNPTRIALKESYRFLVHRNIHSIYIDNQEIRNYVYCTICNKLLKAGQRGTYNIDKHCARHKILIEKTENNYIANKCQRIDKQIENDNIILKLSPTIDADLPITNLKNNHTIEMNDEPIKVSDRWIIRDILNIDFDENGSKVATVFFKGVRHAKIIPIEDIPKYNRNHIKCDNDFTIPSDKEDIGNIGFNKKKRRHHSKDHYKLSKDEKKSHYHHHNHKNG